MMKKVGLRRRWLLNTVGVVSAVGLLLTLVVTGFYAWNCYDAMERDLTNRAEAAAAYFAGDQSPDAEWLKSQCAAYTVDFGQQGTLLLQFYDRKAHCLPIPRAFGDGHPLPIPPKPWHLNKPYPFVERTDTAGKEFCRCPRRFLPALASFWVPFAL